MPAVLVGAISLIWLLVLLTVPWNLYFSARSVIHEAHLSRERGIEVPQARENEAREIARRMLRFAATETGDHDLNRRITQMTRRFDETVDGLSDNQELITGLKAFLRLVRSNPT